MRDILFRGKRIDHGEWDCGNLFDWGGDGSQVAIVPFCEFARYANWEKWLKEYTIPVFPETVGEYTGLKDQNGRWIYEGDIIAPTVPSNLPPCEVVFDVTEGQFIVEDGCGDCHGTLASLGRITDNHYKVVGNKWDNPELLEVEK